MAFVDNLAFVSLLVCFLITIFNFFVWRDIKSPSVLHALLWTSILALHSFVSHGLFPLRFETHLIVIFSMLLFSLGSIFSLTIFKNMGCKTKSFCVLPKNNIIKFYLYIAFIGLPFFILRAYDLASHGSTGNFLIDVRLSLTGGLSSQGYGTLGYLVPIAFSCFYLLLLNKKRSLKSPLIICTFFMCLLYSILSTGRTFLFLLFIPSLFILALTRAKYLTIKKNIIFVGGLFIVFVVFGSFLGKLGSDLHGLLSIFWIYLLGGITAFQELFSNQDIFTYGNYSFRTFYAIFKKIGFDVDVQNLIQKYVHIPYPTNVYSVFSSYFLDFGIYFVFIAQFIFGLFHSCLFLLSKKKNLYAILIYSLSMYMLFMQFFQDQYFSLLSQWIIYGFILLLPFVRIRIVKSPNNLSLLRF